jgi:hypothetical protein
MSNENFPPPSEEPEHSSGPGEAAPMEQGLSSGDEPAPPLATPDDEALTLMIRRALGGGSDSIRARPKNTEYTGHRRPHHYRRDKR